MPQVSTRQRFAETWPSRMALDEAFEAALAGHALPAASAGIFAGLFSFHDWQPWLADAYALLDEPERQRVERRRIPADRDRLALAYALHRLLVSRALGRDARDVTIARDAMGCPRLPDGNLATSLSHADGCIAAAVSMAGAVGVDVEPATRAAVMPEIAERICHPDETASIDALAGPRRNEALLALWVRKEAFLKAAGIGLQREMSAFTAPDEAQLALPDGVMAHIRMLDSGPHWIAAIAGMPHAAIACAWLRP